MNILDKTSKKIVARSVRLPAADKVTSDVTGSDKLRPPKFLLLESENGERPAKDYVGIKEEYSATGALGRFLTGEVVNAQAAARRFDGFQLRLIEAAMPAACAKLATSILGPVAGREFEKKWLAGKRSECLTTLARVNLGLEHVEATAAVMLLSELQALQKIAQGARLTAAQSLAQLSRRAKRKDADRGD